MEAIERSTAISLRPFAGEEDFPRMARVANASMAADVLGIVRRVEDIRRDYASFHQWDPARDMRMAEVGGELAGYARTTDWTTAEGSLVLGQIAFVHPEQRRRGVGTALLRWIEARQREIAAAREDVQDAFHHAGLSESEHDRAHLLRAAGYAPVRHFLTMRRPDLEDIRDFPLPPGFEVRPVETSDLRAIFDAHMEALRGHWGFSPPTPGAFERWTQSRLFQPHLWQVAWHVASNQVAGQVKPWIDFEQNATQDRRRGYTEFISVGAPWRRQGIARALVARALHAQREAGMTESELGVDAANAHDAARLYEACGFRVVQRHAAWRKRVEAAVA
ncbi:GNAT family N-acetyltransferase [Ramlibacter sp. USB13]|uniref:GNAT family N-acetyltransferase n=1 Tax=Ramlibacter cellulosilyticus TaxID=2764187 RepID=A0A923MTC5_9BURK|nr:GNAT family N-acetyltransferase [Ramlibacter cellulosilyticus]MBC5784606.1 GNAT family N-acetyltransferase [Ramlibacter cellulosilyticus]